MSHLGLSEDDTDGLSDWSGYYLGSQFGKAWLEENKGWISPPLIAAIERGLKTIHNSGCESITLLVILISTNCAFLASWLLLWIYAREIICIIK